MAKPNALKDIRYLGHATTQRSFKFHQHISSDKGNGYLEQKSNGTFEFAYRGDAIGDPNLLVFSIKHSAGARFKVEAKKSKDDPVIFQVEVRVDMIYEIPASAEKGQKRIKSYKWYFEDCARPLVQMIITDLLKDTGYKMS